MNIGESKDKKSEYALSAIGPLVGLLTTIITAFTNLPTAIKSTLIILLVIVTLISIYVVFVPLFVKYIKRMNITLKHHSLTKKYFTEFEKLVDRFRKLIDENHCDSIVYVLKDLQTKAMLGGILPFPGDFTYAFDAFSSSMRKLPLKKQNFLIILRWFESVIDLSNKYLVCNPIKEIRKIDKGIVPNICKEKYEECKLTYDRLLDDYMEFARYLNKQFGETIAREYFEKPVKL